MRRFLSISRFAVYLLSLIPPLVAQSYLSGLVYVRQDAGFVPIAKARVEARSVALNRRVARVETDAYGHYVFSNLPAGEVEVRVSHPRYYAANDAERRGGKRANCSGSGTCGQVDFDLIRSGELAVHITDSSGQALDEVRVTVRALAQPEVTSMQQPVLRAKRGVFRAYGMQPGRYRVRVEPGKRRKGIIYHRRSTELNFEAGERSRSIRLVMPSTRTYRVSGRVFGLVASAAQRMVLVLDPSDDGRAESGPTLPRLGTPLDGGGRFVVHGVPRGTYSLQLLWPRDSAVDLSGGPRHLLGEISVNDDLGGLLFTAPPGIGVE